MFETPVITLPTIVVASASLIAGATDLWKYRVYNWLTFPLLLTGLLYQAYAHGVSGLGFSLLGMVFGFSVLILPHVLGLMGAGDVKLLAGIGAWLGFSMTAFVFAAAALVSGLLAVSLIIIRGKFAESWATLSMILTRLLMAPSFVGRDDLVHAATASHDRRLRAIPFAATIPMGLALTYWCTLQGWV